LWTLVLTAGDELGLRSVNQQLVLVCLIGTLTIAVTALVARDLVSVRAGVIAAVVATLYPGFWIYDGEVLSEALTMLLAALTILAAYRCFRACTTGRVVVLGLLAGLCALTRAELVLLIPLVALPTVLWQRSYTWSRRLALCGVAVAVAVAPMLPWFARNLATFHHPVYLSDQFEATIASANNPSTYEGPLTASWCYPCLLAHHFAAADDESDQAVYWSAQAKRYILAHKVRALEVAVDRVGLEWSIYQPGRQARQDFLEGWPVPVAQAWLVWYYPLEASAIVGAVILRRRRTPIYPLVAMVATVTFAALVTYGNQRFRTEAEVAIVILAAAAFDALWSSVEGRPGRRSLRPPAGADDGNPAESSGHPSASDGAAGDPGDPGDPDRSPLDAHRPAAEVHS
jgi:4-amino-4-deoxy-L-arabinose transferase-like glycosyltransferase